MNQVVKDFGKGFKQLGQETAEKLVQETGKIAESVITAKELLGDINPMSDEELEKKKMEDERKKQKEMSDVRSQMSGRNVESELEQIRKNNEKEDEERERYFEKLKQQQEIEEQQQMEYFEPIKSKQKKGNPHKKQQPDQSQMSQTSEFKGKIN